MRATDQMLARISAEIEEKQTFIDGAAEPPRAMTSTARRWSSSPAHTARVS